MSIKLNLFTLTDQPRQVYSEWSLKEKMPLEGKFVSW